MAKLTKTKARKPLAKGKLMLSTHENAQGRVITLLIQGECAPGGGARYYRLESDSYEAMTLAVFIARQLTMADDDRPSRTAAQCLRDLADRKLKEG